MFRARRAKPDQIEGEMTRGEIVPNTIRAVGVSVCRRRSGWRRDRDSFGRSLQRGLPALTQRNARRARRADRCAGSWSTVLAIRHLRSRISHSPRRPRVTGRWPVPGSCRCSCGGAKRRARAGPHLRSGGGLGRASSRSSSEAPIIQSSSINRRTLCVSVIGRESHRGG
jgi:hypothetical protein